MRKNIILVVLFMAVALFTAGCGGKINFTLPSTKGAEFNSEADAKGKPVFIAFMATYCGYCKMSVPMVNALQAKYEDKGLVVLGVFSDNTPEGPAQYVKDFNVAYTSLYGGGELSEKAMVNGVPHFVLLNKDHKIVRMWSGYSPNHDFEEYIERVLR